MLMPDNSVFVKVENPNMAPDRTKNARLPMAERLTTFQEVEQTYTEEEALREASRCLGCPSRWCSKECPAGMPVPEFIRKVREKDYEGAYELISSASPLPEFCSRLCPQEKQCQSNCTRSIRSEAVGIGRLERFVVEQHYLSGQEAKAVPSTGKRVAVIGSGPASLVVAIKLALAGVDVTVFERQPDVGGVLRYGIPEYRLPKTLVSKYRDRLTDLGVRVRPNTTIGETITIEDLFRDGYDAVFVGTGTWRAKTAGVAGETGGNVLFGMDYLVSPETCSIGQRVAVIGAGNTAMDVARTAFRQGAREVTVYARSKHVSASSDELEYALLDGCELVQGKAICEINERGPVFRTAIFDADDKVAGYENELDQVECDTVIVAVSQKPANRLIATTDGLEADERGLLVVDETGQTSVPGVFAAGDVVTGPNTVVHAVAATKIAVEGMLEHMGVA